MKIEEKKAEHVGAFRLKDDVVLSFPGFLFISYNPD